MTNLTLRTRRTAGRVLLLCLIVFASRTTWYDTRVVFKSLLYDSSIRWMFLAYAVCLFPFILIAFQGIKHLFSSWLMTLFAVINLCGIVLAVIYGNPGIYIIQDVFKMTLVPVGFLLVWHDPPDNADRLLERLAKVIFGYQVAKLLIYILYFRSQYGFVYGGVTDLFPLCFFGAKVFSGARRTDPWDILMATSSLVMITMGQKRTLMVCVAVIAIYLLVRNFSHVVRRLWPYLAMATCLIVFLVFGGQIEGLTSHDQFRRLMETNVESSIGDESKRGREVRIVYEDLQEYGWIGYVFGIGHGAIYEEEVEDTLTGNVTTHSVHFTPAAMHLRYGIFGMAIYLFMTIHLMFYRGTPIPGWISKSSLRGMKAFGLSIVICSLTGFGLVDDLMAGSIIGLMMLSRQKLRSRKLAKKSPSQTLRRPTAPYLRVGRRAG